jgi:phosphatidylinositol-4,5-bisphosphate 3-kinase
MQLNNELYEYAHYVQTLKGGHKEGTDYVQEKLHAVKDKFFRNKNLKFALDARLEAQDFDYEKCKVIDSKKLPIWLEMKNS